ncbi:MLP-like protein [Forsythia ovata]|uniref:MLP-like protein n=1 Tax=Forsythia ovata TaxID=205694 RepID=A0ABD1W8L0_9LAMI
MSTARSHVLNCELYKVLASYVESKTMDSKDDDELPSKNKILHSKLALTEEARHQVEFKAIKSETMQNVCNDAWRRAELKLKVYEDMAYIKHKDLAGAQVELLKAKELLARLGVQTSADPDETAGPYDLYFTSEYKTSQNLLWKEECLRTKILRILELLQFFSRSYSSFYGKQKVAKDVVEAIDKEKRSVTFNVIEGDLTELYTVFKIGFHVETNGDTDLVLWTLEYEKLNDEVDEPLTLLGVLIKLSKDIESHHLKA